MDTKNLPAPRARALLAEATRERLLAPARRAGYDLPLIGTSEAPEGEFLWQAPTERWWVFNDHRDDPTVAQYGGVVVPADVKERLTKLLAEGFSPDLILIGHEMPDRWKPGEPVPELVPVSTQTLPAAGAATPVLPRLVTSQTSRDVGVGALKVGKAAFLGGLALGVLTGQVVAAVAAAAAQLDPVIVAGVRAPGASYATWVEVARWEW